MKRIIQVQIEDGVSQLTPEQAHESLGVIFTDHCVTNKSLASVSEHNNNTLITLPHPSLLGRRLKAMKPFKKSDPIIEYTGLICSKGTSGASYQFQKAKGKVVDAQSVGNESRYSEHSFENIHDLKSFFHLVPQHEQTLLNCVRLANAGAEILRDKIYLTALRDIDKDDYISWDYNSSYWKDSHQLPLLTDKKTGEPLPLSWYEPLQIPFTIKLSGEGEDTYVSHYLNTCNLKEYLDFGVNSDTYLPGLGFSIIMKDIGAVFIYKDQIKAALDSHATLQINPSTILEPAKLDAMHKELNILALVTSNQHSSEDETNRAYNQIFKILSKNFNHLTTIDKEQSRKTTYMLISSAGKLACYHLNKEEYEQAFEFSTRLMDIIDLISKYKRYSLHDSVLHKARRLHMDITTKLNEARQPSMFQYLFYMITRNIGASEDNKPDSCTDIEHDGKSEIPSRLGNSL